MSSLFKQKVVRYVDANGKRVRKSTPGAKKKNERSSKWYGEYIDAKNVTRRAPLSTDKAASQAQLNDLVKQAERRKAGLTNPFDDHRLIPIITHIEDYRQFLIAKDNTSDHVTQTISRIEKLVKGCEFLALCDIEGTKVAVWLSDQRKNEKRFSAQTSNFYLDGFLSRSLNSRIAAALQSQSISMLLRCGIRKISATGLFGVNVSPATL